jgi:hypothetical protein
MTLPDQTEPYERTVKREARDKLALMAWILSKVPGLKAIEVRATLGLTREVYDTFLHYIESIDWQERQDLISGHDSRKASYVGGDKELEKIGGVTDDPCCQSSCAGCRAGKVDCGSCVWFWGAEQDTVRKPGKRAKRVRKTA